MIKIIKIICITVLIALIIFPLLMYRYHFNPDIKPDWFPYFANLSKSNGDWGDFGSYLSGLYSSIFSFLSLLAVLYSLRETQKFNTNQTALLKSEQFTNEFMLLLNTLTKLLSEKKYPAPNSSDDNGYKFFKENLYKQAASIIQQSKNVNRSNYKIFGMSEVGMRLTQRYVWLYEKEAPIYAAIISRINQSEIIQANAYKAILLASTDNDTRYMLTSLLASSHVQDLYKLAVRLDVFETPAYYESLLVQAIMGRD